MITIVDYKAGNLTSVRRALSSLGIECKITASPDEIFRAERIIFPGVGNAESAMKNLTESGIAVALKAAIKRGAPAFGICLGMQIMMRRSDEGDVNCLGIFDGGVELLRPGIRGLKIPHMGWNGLKYLIKHELFGGIDPRAEFYFVHSYRVAPAEGNDVIAVSDHGVEFPSVIGRGNVFATQFHPEKSGGAGLKMLKNFSTWEPKADGGSGLC
jgi:glutamine amidotransferase